MNEDTAWEVALTSVQYTNRFYDLREYCTLHFVLENYSTTAIVTTALKPAGSTELPANFTATSTSSMTAVEQRIMSVFRAPGHRPMGASKTIASYVHAKASIPAGDYKNPMLVIQQLASTINATFGSARYSTNVVPSLDGQTGRLLLRLEVASVNVPNTNCALYLFTENVPLIHALGVAPNPIDKLEPAVYGLTHGSKTPRFDAVHSLYIYSDVVKEQRVGDTLAPLLEIVPVRGVPGNRVHYSVNPLTYLPVNRDYVDSINIVIMDEYGKPVTFPDDIENVVCRLRFRRMRPHAMQI
jgi:hypothetical protein